MKRITQKVRKKYTSYLEAEPEEHHRLLKRCLRYLCWFFIVWLMVICVISIASSIIYNATAGRNILRVLPRIIAPNVFFILSVLFTRKYLLK